MSSLVGIGQMILEKIFKLGKCILQFRNYLPLEKGVALYLKKSLVEIGPVVLEKRFLNLVNMFLLFHNYLPLKRTVDIYLNKLESPPPKDALCQVWL